MYVLPQFRKKGYVDLNTWVVNSQEVGSLKYRKQGLRHLDTGPPSSVDERNSWFINDSIPNESSY